MINSLATIHNAYRYIYSVILKLIVMMGLMNPSLAVS